MRMLQRMTKRKHSNTKDTLKVYAIPTHRYDYVTLTTKFERKLFFLSVSVLLIAVHRFYHEIISLLHLLIACGESQLAMLCIKISHEIKVLNAVSLRFGMRIDSTTAEKPCDH